MADPSVETTTSGRCLVATVSGEMDYLTDPVFRPQFKELIARGERFIVLDLSGGSFWDSAGPNVLLGAWRQAEFRRGGAGAGLCARAAAADP
ncbi:STAS domain-containing protein [Streptomyces sp. UG1]|uniref:STAS domain-containing protein n=1 Tax=Streptomyces sp. UG1 TaxID=3417652 RepID=UPI003CFA2F40